MQQHEPSPTSQSILLNANYKDRAVFQLYNPSLSERVRLPWLNKTRTKVASISGVVMSAEDITPGSVSMEKRKEAMVLLWRAWGHLIKDFHVSGDLDFLCVAVDRFKEAQENEEHIRSVRQIDEKVNEEQHALEVSNGDLLFRSGKHNAVSPHKGGKKSAVRHYVPLSADFAVVECCLERKGLPHNMVLEDITKALTDMQTQSLEALRFALIDEIEMLDEEIDLSSVVPVLYAPKIVVTHAGVIEKGTHSYQRIRIRGSCLAHIETLANALRMENYFTDGEVPSVVPEEGRPLEVLPENLSFTPRHAATPHGSGSRRLVGHRLRSSSRGGAGHEGEQVVQAYEDSMISQEERDFWRENYYRLSSLKLLYHNRIDARDALLNKGLNPRLSEHIRVINSKLLGDEAEGEDTRRVTQRRKKSLEVGQIPPEKMFEYYCTDCEAETAMWDLKVGDSHGYDYNVRLRKIPAKDVDYVTPAVHSLQGKGFINYFGTSRFSSYTRHNMHPGLHLLKGEFRAAANVIVQQFYVDAAVEAERRRTGSAFPSNGKQFPRMVDFAHQSGRRTISEHGTALQKVLNNALQASLFLNDQRRPDGLLEESELGLDDPLRGGIPEPDWHQRLSGDCA
ncbi:tRNA pseudouridine synthase D (TruD), putative [Angomonas deanei]|uniref:tRNA pseudouridine synthase D (TruD), putative n=1 Tax=Angomonas deanei TaxID=59799 RepID=A0A7G2C603_9TRYP|nr:tRNA pseudouridine synthase D (TruD), putative [Angomonas deanei]